MDMPAVGFEGRAEIGAGGAFSIGAGDVENGGQAAVRVVETREQLRDALKAEDVGARRQARQAVELGLDGGVGRDGVVGHFKPSPRRGEGLGEGQSRPPQSFEERLPSCS